MIKTSEGAKLFAAEVERVYGPLFEKAYAMPDFELEFSFELERNPTMTLKEFADHWEGVRKAAAALGN